MFSAFNPSKCTHMEQWAANCAAPGEQSWTSCLSRDSNPQPRVTSGFKSNALSIRPRLSIRPSLQYMNHRAAALSAYLEAWGLSPKSAKKLRKLQKIAQIAPFT